MWKAVYEFNIDLPYGKSSSYLQLDKLILNTFNRFCFQSPVLRYLKHSIKRQHLWTENVEAPTKKCTRNHYYMHTFPKLFCASGTLLLPVYITYYEWIKLCRLQVQVTTQTLVQLSTSHREQMTEWCSAVYTARMVAVFPSRPQRDAKAMTWQWSGKSINKERWSTRYSSYYPRG